MKKNFLLFLSLSFSVLGLAQPWNTKIDPGTTPTFFDFQNAFNSYWRGVTPGKGEGYNQFRRWEWFWEQRVGLSGQFPPSDINYKEWQKFEARTLLYKASPVKTKWTFLGPVNTPGGYNGIGRINCVTFHPTDPDIFWVGSPGGGIWKTTDMGQTWVPLSDFNAVLGVSSIAVNPNYPDSIYIATGDGEKGSLWGMTGGPQGDNKSIGILLSSDGGLSWKQTGMNWNISEAKLISKIIMDPGNSRRLLIASSDGVYMTTDAGATWTKKQTGYFMDIAFCPGNPLIVYATTYNFNGNAKMYRSRNGGNSFTETFAKGLATRMTIGTTPANPKKVQLLIADKKNGKFGGIHESIDTGKSFIIKYDTGIINILSSAYNGKTDKGQGWYDLAYIISPTDENLVFVGGVNTWVSDDGASSFSLNSMWTANKKQNPDSIQTIHADKHFFAYNPLNGYLFECNDGGIYYSTNSGTTWKDISSGLGIMQFYRMSITESDTNMILAGAQDNGTKLRRGQTWFESTGGDGMDCAIDPVDPEIYYSGIQYGKINRIAWGETTVISDNIEDKPKGSWVTPYVIDPNEHSTLYAGFKMIYKSTDFGESWLPICDSLWKPNYVINIAVAPTNSQIIYASDYYKIFRTTNGGNTWSSVTNASQPITCIKVHPKNPDLIYYTVSSYQNGSKVHRVNLLANISDKFTNLSLNLPNVAVNCIVFDKNSREGLYIGTDVGTFYKDTAMGAWESLNSNMPNVVVTDLEINYKDRLLYASTFGRGVWKTPVKVDPKLIGPAITVTEPADNSTKIHPNTQLIIYFNEPVKKGSGMISIFEGTVEKQKININSDSAVILGNKVIVTPGQFTLGKPVNIKFPKGTFLDGDNNEHKGVIAATEWNFTITTDTKTLDLNIEKPVVILPNPSRGVIYIKTAPDVNIKTISLYNALGELVMEKTNPSNDFELNLEALAKGLYHIGFDIDGQMISQRIVLE